MQRPVWLRVLIALWGVWFATALTEPAGIMACPQHSGLESVGIPHGGMHGSKPAAMPMSHDMASMDMASMDMASMEMADAGHDVAARTGDNAITARPADAPDDSGHSCCTCLGTCSTMPPATLPCPPAAMHVPESLQATVAIYPDVQHAPQRADLALPFANGPPRTALS